MNHLSLAVRLLDDGRRAAVLALDAARDHIEAVVDHPGDPAEVLRLLSYAAARLDGSLATGLDPETVSDEEQHAIVTRALELVDRELEALDAEQPELVTDAQILAVALSMTCERLVAMASESRVSRCTWCGRSVLVAAAVAHAIECDRSPGAAAMRAIARLTEILGDRPDSAIASRVAIDQERIGSLVAAAVSRFAPAEGDPQTTSRLRGPMPVIREEPSHVAKIEYSTGRLIDEAPMVTAQERREWEHSKEPEQRVRPASHDLANRAVDDLQPSGDHLHYWSTVESDSQPSDEGLAAGDYRVGGVTVTHTNPRASGKLLSERTYPNLEQAVAAVQRSTHEPEDVVRAGLAGDGVRVGDDLWRVRR